MRKEFKRLKRWVEMCPIEAAMRIEELEQQQQDYTETLNQARRKRDEVKSKLEVALKDNKQFKQALKDIRFLQYSFIGDRRQLHEEIDRIFSGVLS